MGLIQMEMRGDIRKEFSNQMGFEDNGLARNLIGFSDEVFFRKDLKFVFSKYLSELGASVLPSIESEFLKIGAKYLALNSSIGTESLDKTVLILNSENYLNYLKFRAEIYREMGYDKQFPRPLQGIEFDIYDECSLGLCYKNDGQIVANLRIILDSGLGLPSDKVTGLDSLRDKGNIAEISRVMVNPQFRGRGLLNILMYEASDLAVSLGYNYFVLGTLVEHVPIYSKFGKQNVIFNGNYGAINKDCAVFSLDLLHKGECN